MWLFTLTIFLCGRLVASDLDLGRNESRNVESLDELELDSS